MAVIAFMTDFGTQDHYVAAMKGMVLQVDPKAVLVDITHQIAAQDILGGAFVLRQAFPYFPPGTIFIAVVDPGVGTRRRILAGQFNDRIVLAPDNGLLTFLRRDADLQSLRVVENRKLFAATLSNTFHGRDIFAPVAGHLSRGTALDRVGPPADRMDVLPLPAPARQPDGSIHGEVIYIDRFGNLITNISELDLSAAHIGSPHPQVHLHDRRIGPLHVTYGDAPVGEPLALIGSTQMLEIAVHHGHAADTLHADRGTPVRVTCD